MRILFGAPAMLALAVTMAAAVAAEPPGDPANGRELAGRLCASCHLVAPEQPGPTPDAVPSFMAIAARPDASENRILAALLSPPHPAMPSPPLARRQMSDVAAYILSLRRP